MGHKRTTRGKGEGSVYKRGDGYWVAAVEAGRDPNGRRRKLRAVRARKADALEALDDLRKRAHLGVIPNRIRTVGEFLEFWLTDVIASEVTAGTLHEYRTRVNRIVPVIGRVRLDRLTVADVQRLANVLATNYPRSPKTRNHTIATLRQALRWAAGANMIIRNPAEHVTVKMSSVTVDDTLEPGEVKRVLAAASDDTELGAFWWLALVYGLRTGELMALRWSDIDFTKDEMTVRRAVTKTDAGHRTLPLTAEAKRVLQDHRRARMGTMVPIEGYVFHRENGLPLYHQLVHNRWNDLLRQAGIAHLCRNCGSDDECSTSVRRFHSSRHTAATTLLEAGVALEVVSRILGHSNIGITSSIYAKVRGDRSRSCRDRPARRRWPFGPV
jgi:integrase